MKHTPLYITILYLMTLTVHAQTDIQLASAVYSPQEVQIGETSTLQLTVRNSGSAAINPYSIEVQISAPYPYYGSEMNAPTTAVANSFIWTYVDQDYWKGVNRTSIPANSNIDISMDVLAYNNTPRPETTDVLVKPIRYFSQS